MFNNLSNTQLFIFIFVTILYILCLFVKRMRLLLFSLFYNLFIGRLNSSMNSSKKTKFFNELKTMNSNNHGGKIVIIKSYISLKLIL